MVLDKRESCSTPGGSVSDLAGLFCLVARGLERRGLIPDSLMSIMPGSGGWPCVPECSVHCGRIVMNEAGSDTAWDGRLVSVQWGEG